ncbi:MAG: peptidyl-prolyl cis-trans isomerase [Gemmatimonadaceae bacterium]|nr:peptidyl-prolyl cis-trans isomerase [Gemmatimonadaceae bacterium]
MKRSLTALAALVVTLTACEGFKEAMTAHVDVAAKAGSQELSVDRLGALLSQSKVPVNAQIAKAVTNLWVDYQLLGQAAAHGDSLNDPKLVDEALWPIIAQERVGKWHDQVAKTFSGLDTTNLEARYASGEMLAARHILLLVPQGATQAQRDSIRKRAEALRSQVTGENFAELAKKNSQDPSSAARGGDLGLFPKGVMVKEFQDALLALKPGQISPVVQTQFGYHIIRRSTFSEVKDEFTRAVNAGAMRTADSTYLAKLEATGNVQIADNAVTTVRDAAKDFDAHTKDGAVIATSKAGPFTVARLVKWVEAYPQKAQIEQGLQQVPDSQVVKFIRNVVRNELVLQQADSAKVELDSAELADLHNRFSQVVVGTWEQLGVSPKALADSGKSAAERERIAAGRIDSYLDKLMAQQVRFVDVPAPVEAVLRQKYTWKVNAAGLDRAVERAAKQRAAADSARVKNRPPSEVPLGAPAKPDSSGAKH